MNMYKKIEKDFNFVALYGYKYDHKLPSNIAPSIVFSNNVYEIEIGFDYVIDRIYINFYENPFEINNNPLNRFKPLVVKCLLDDVVFESPKYEDQVEKAKIILKKLLES